MGKWGKRLREHISSTNTRSDQYVNYKILKKGIRSCDVNDFETLYIAEVLKFVANIENGLKSDPKFVDVNIRTLKNARKKFDKFHRRTYEERMGFKDFEDRKEKLRDLEILILEHMKSKTASIRFRIRENEKFARMVFEELTREVRDDGKKVLSREQLSAALQRLGLPASSDTVEELMCAVDRDKDGFVDWHEFKNFMSVREPQIRSAFKKMDTEKKGYILPHQIVHAMKILNVKNPEDVAENLIVASKTRRQRTSSLWLRDIGETDGVNTLLDSGDEINLEKLEGIDYLTFREMVLLLPALHDRRSVLEYWQEIAGMDNEFTLYRGNEGNGMNSRTESALITLVAGSIAGAVSRTCTAPFDRLKMVMQVDPKFGRLGILGGIREIYQNGKTHRVGYDGKFAMARGWRGILAGSMAFFRGNGTNVTKIAPESAIKFLSYEVCKSYVLAYQNRDQNDNDWWQDLNVDLENVDGYDTMSPSSRFFCGAVAGATAQTLIYPLEVVKTRLAVSTIGTYSGISHALFKISRQEGVFALTRGLGASLLGIIPFSGTDMGVYFYLREQVVPRMVGDRRLSRSAEVASMLGCGMISSTCGMIVAYPLHLVRTRLQVDGLTYMPSYTGIYGCVKHTIQNEGFRGLYRGFGANLLKAIPSISISYAIFETAKQRISNY